MDPISYLRVMSGNPASDAERQQAVDAIRSASEYVLPTSPAEAGAMALFGPFGKAAKLGGLGAMLGGYGTEADAGGGLTLAREFLKAATEYARTLKGAEKTATERYAFDNDFSIADVLRSGQQLDPGTLDYVKTLDRVLEKAPRADQEFSTFRGGIPVSGRDRAFVSVSTEPDIAQGYVDGAYDHLDDLGDSVPPELRIRLMEYLIGKNTPLLNPDALDSWGHSELLLPRNGLLTPKDGLNVFEYRP